jgi:hypothetical protein
MAKLGDPQMRIEIVLGVAAASMSASANAQQAVQWRVQDGGNGHWYASRPQAVWVDWLQARSLAESVGGHLPTIRSQGEDDFVRALFAGIPIPTWGPALGGVRTQSQAASACSGWSWITGEPFDFVPRLPSDHGSANYCQDESSLCDCLNNYYPSETVLHYWYSTYPVWNSTGVSDQSSLVLIEWDADCNSDGVVDYGQILSGVVADANANGVPDCCESSTPCCPTDVFRDFRVDGIDLGILLGQWGAATGFTVTDFNGDGFVDGSDLGILLSTWGPCVS